jgi:hypothetical protein
MRACLVGVTIAFVFGALGAFGCGGKAAPPKEPDGKTAAHAAKCDLPPCRRAKPEPRPACDTPDCDDDSSVPRSACATGDCPGAEPPCNVPPCNKSPGRVVAEPPCETIPCRKAEPKKPCTTPGCNKAPEPVKPCTRHPC